MSTEPGQLRFRRALVRRSTPRAWWRGLVPLTGLVAGVLLTLIWFPRAVQHTIERDVNARLNAAGHHWARVTVSGQHVTLRGSPPSEAAASHAIELAKTTQSATWAGMASSISEVQPAFERPPAQPGAAWVIRRDPDRIWLSGRMSSDAVVREVLDSAYQLGAASSPPAEVRSSLYVDPDVHPTDVGARAVSLLEHCPRGHVWMEQGEISVRCEVVEAAHQALLERELDRLAEHVPVAATDVYLRSVADACDAAFAALTSRKIRFVPGSVQVQPQSASIIYDLARAVRQCPGQIRVSVHTDNTANAELGVHLTQMRAESIRTALGRRGVDAERLVAVGMGPHRPLESNATPEGRAANRRVDIHVIRPNDQ